MPSPPEIERKVKQLDNDVLAIYGLLTTIEATQKRHGNRLDEVAATLAAYSATSAVHGEKLDSHTEKLDAILELLRGRDA